MARIGHEGPRIGQHADEARNQAAIGKRVNLPGHRLFLVEEPPAAAELDLAGHRAILEIADHGGQYIVIGWIQVVQHDLRQ